MSLLPRKNKMSRSQQDYRRYLKRCPSTMQIGENSSNSVAITNVLEMNNGDAIDFQNP